MSMELVLPAREPPVRGEPLAAPRRARKWCEQIRQLGDRESARQFIEGLQRFNRIELRRGTRLKIAELLRPTARYLIDRLSQRISTRKLPLDDVSGRNFRALLLLLREMALAYDICCADLAAQRRPSARTLALATERALYYRGETMLRSAPVHSPLPQNFWHDSNTLFLGAERHHCVDRRVRNEELLARGKRHTPRAMYKRLLLFALAPTDGLRRGQAQRLFERAESWAELARMSTESPSALTNTLYCVDLARPDGPHPAGNEPGATETMRWIEFGPVLIAARQLLPEAPSEGSVLEPGQVDATTLQRLIDAWSVHSGRAGERVARDEFADVEVSLRDIHARLAAEYAPAKAETPAHSPRPTGSLSSLALQTIEAPERRWRQIDDEDDVEPPAEPATKAAPKHSDNAEQERKWLLIEAGGGGFRLRWEAGEPSTAVVGDLVALRDESGQAAGEGEPPRHSWSLGTIRRIRMIDDRRFDAGVQVLGRDPVPARLRREPANPHRKRDRASETSEPALFLPAERERKTPATVLVAANTFDEGDVVELDLPERVVRLRLAPSRDGSAAYARFRLEKPPARGRRAGAADDEEPPG